MLSGWLSCRWRWHGFASGSRSKSLAGCWTCNCTTSPVLSLQLQLYAVLLQAGTWPKALFQNFNLLCRFSHALRLFCLCCCPALWYNHPVHPAAPADSMSWDMEDMGAVMMIPVVFCLHIVLICLGTFTGRSLLVLTKGSCHGESICIAQDEAAFDFEQVCMFLTAHPLGSQH